jgi:Cys-tRNA(Pro) deacylase
MAQALSPGAQRVQDELARRGFAHQVSEFARPTRSAAEAAQEVGCRVEQIAKSLVFKSRTSQRPVLVIASGANRVNEQTVGQLIGEPIERADADFVRARTGYAIGGVSPVGLSEPVEVVIDEDLLRHEEIWAAAGTPNAVFRLPPADLVAMTGGRVASIT